MTERPILTDEQLREWMDEHTRAWIAESRKHPQNIYGTRLLSLLREIAALRAERDDLEQARSHIKTLQILLDQECEHKNNAWAQRDAVRAEERARDGSWERLSRETAEGLKSALDAIAAKDAEIAALRNALEKARPFVELQIGAPAAGKIFLESVSLLPVIDAALEMSGCP